MKPMIGTCAAIALAVAGLFLLPVASAHAHQQPTDTPPATSPKTSIPDQKTDIPDQKLDKVAAAAKRVVAVSDSYEQRLAKTPAGEKEHVVDEANQAITKAVTDQGISVEEYVSIMKVAQNDATVRDKLVQRLK